MQKQDQTQSMAMTKAQIWGRRVMLAVLSLVLAVPAVNLRRLMTEGVPLGLQHGEINFAYVVGMFFSVLLVLVWYFAYVGRGRARVMLGIVYLLTTSLTVVVPMTLLFKGTDLPPSWPRVSRSSSPAAIRGSPRTRPLPESKFGKPSALIVSKLDHRLSTQTETCLSPMTALRCPPFESMEPAM